MRVKANSSAVLRTILVLASLAGACAPSGASPSSPAARTEAHGTVDAPRQRQGEQRDTRDRETPADPQGLPAEAAEVPQETRGAGSEPLPAELPWEPEVPVAASVSPACVEPGGTVTIEVTTEPEAAIAYNAVYAGNKSGSPAPFGYGYGGNDKGYASKKSGTWESTWIVRIDAPRGPAKVDVIVGYRGEFGYDDPHFAVADASGGCPEEWLAADDEEKK
jgi:hypothetical protein